MAWGTKAGSADYQAKREAAASTGNLFRFYVKAGESKKIIFLADERQCVLEHMEKIGQKWERFTCSEDANCYFCGVGKSRSFVEYSTILDLTPYTTKDGQKRRYSRRAFGASGSAIDILDRRRVEKGGSLAGYGCECIRDEGKTPAVGNDFKMSAEKIDLKKHYPEAKEFDFKPFDFSKVLAPKTAEQVQSMLRFQNASISTFNRADLGSPPDDSFQPEYTDQDIPF